MTDWATVEDVKSLTKIVVVPDDIEPAQAIIELMAGTTTNASDRHLISTYNLRMLKWAVAYQAAWMSQHPDVFTNVDVSQVSEGRFGVSGTPGNENAFLVAPLALRCLRRLSWWNRPMRALHSDGLAPWESRRGNRDSVGYDEDAPDWTAT